MNKQEKVKALVEAFANENYGVTIEHYKIASIIDERQGSQKYREIVDKAKKELLDSGKMIANSVSGTGWCLPTSTPTSPLGASSWGRSA